MAENPAFFAVALSLMGLHFAVAPEQTVVSVGLVFQAADGLVDVFASAGETGSVVFERDFVAVEPARVEIGRVISSADGVMVLGAVAFRLVLALSKTLQ